MLLRVEPRTLNVELRVTTTGFLFLMCVFQPLLVSLDCSCKGVNCEKVSHPTVSLKYSSSSSSPRRSHDKSRDVRHPGHASYGQMGLALLTPEPRLYFQRGPVDYRTMSIPCKTTGIPPRVSGMRECGHRSEKQDANKVAVGPI